MCESCDGWGFWCGCVGDGPVPVETTRHPEKCKECPYKERCTSCGGLGYVPCGCFWEFARELGEEYTACGGQATRSGTEEGLPATSAGETSGMLVSVWSVDDVTRGGVLCRSSKGRLLVFEVQSFWTHLKTVDITEVLRDSLQGFEIKMRDDILRGYRKGGMVVVIVEAAVVKSGWRGRILRDASEFKASDSIIVRDLLCIQRAVGMLTNVSAKIEGGFTETGVIKPLVIGSGVWLRWFEGMARETLGIVPDNIERTYLARKRWIARVLKENIYAWGAGVNGRVTLTTCDAVAILLATLWAAHTRQEDFMEALEATCEREQIDMAWLQRALSEEWQRIKEKSFRAG